MAELTGPLSEFLAVAIPQEASTAHKHNPLIPAEDFEQEMWVEALSRRDDFERLMEQGARGVVRRRVRKATWRLAGEDERYRRAVKAAHLGYSPADEQYYSHSLLKTLIPMFLDDGVAERPPQGRELTGRVSGGGGGQSDYPAMMLDIDYAMGAIKAYHRSILERYYAYPQGSGGWTHAEIASDLGIEQGSLKGRIYRARTAMIRKLGGRNPWPSRKAEPATYGGREAA